MEWIDNDNDDKCNNNRHIPTEIINSEKIETTWDEYILRVSKAHKQQIRRLIKARKNRVT